MKLTSVIFYLSLLLMSGCATIPDQDAIIPSVRDAQQGLSTSNDFESDSSVNQPVEVGHWNITMKPKQQSTQSAEFYEYSVEYTYVGQSKVTHANIRWGNGSVELKDISYGEGGTLRSTFSKDTKHIEFSMTSREENGEAYGQTLVFKTGQ